MDRWRLGRRSTGSSNVLPDVLPDVTPDVLPDVTLYDRLCADYPEISARAVSDALASARAAAAPGGDLMALLELGARATLTSARSRSAAALGRARVPRPRGEPA